VVFSIGVMVMEQSGNNRSLSGGNGRGLRSAMNQYNSAYEVRSALDNNASSRSLNTNTASTMSSPSDPGESSSSNTKMNISTVAVKPKEESLYESLIRYHVEQQGGPPSNKAETEPSPPRRKSAPVGSLLKSGDDDDDKKPAAIPVVLEGKPRKPLAMPYSRHHTAPKDSPPSPPSQSRPLSRSSSMYSRTRSRRGDVDSDSVGSTEQPRLLLRRGSGRENRTPNGLEKQSSFYKSLLDAADQIQQPPPVVETRMTSSPSRHVPNTLDVDLEAERLQLELLKEEEAAQARKDEELARQLQRQLALEDEERANRDAALALRLQQEQMPKQPDPDSSTLQDAMLARELSRMQTIQNNEEVVPEQVNILEQIRTEQERKLIERQVLETQKEAQQSNDDLVYTGEVAVSEWASASHPEFRQMPQNAMPVRPSGLQASSTWSGDNHVPQTSSSRDYRRYQSHDNAPTSQPQQATAFRRSYSACHPHPRIEPQRSVHFIDERESRPLRRPLDRRQSTPLPIVSSIPPPSPQPATVEPTHESLRRGNRETRMAMNSGASHVIKCQGCNVRLHAPLSYSLVFCPNCRTVSPGQTVPQSRSTGNVNSRSNSRRSRLAGS